MTDWNMATKKQMTPEELASLHDFVPYFSSLADELLAVKDRVRRLVKHWPTDGHFKEAIFRTMLRKHIPECFLVGTGFVVNSFGPSTEIDILIADRSMPTLFKENELLIVTPEAVRAIIEVKTALDGQSKLTDTLSRLAAQKSHVQRHVVCKDVWAGLFVYEANGDWHERLLRAAGDAMAATGSSIDAITFGADTFVKFFSIPEEEGGQKPANAWRSFDEPGLAPTDFIASLIEAILPPGKEMGSFAWFNRPGGIRKRWYLSAAPGSQPSTFPVQSSGG